MGIKMLAYIVFTLVLLTTADNYMIRPREEVNYIDGNGSLSELQPKGPADSNKATEVPSTNPTLVFRDFISVPCTGQGQVQTSIGCISAGEGFIYPNKANEKYTYANNDDDYVNPEDIV